MIAFIYRCPRTGQQIQGWAADHLAEGETYEPVTCTGCGRIHLVNPKTGKVLETGKNSPSTTRYKFRQLRDIRRDPPAQVYLSE